MHTDVLAEDHPDRLASQHELARVYHADGQVKKAVKLLEHVVAIQTDVLAEDHPDRLVSEQALANLCEDLLKRSGIGQVDAKPSGISMNKGS